MRIAQIIPSLRATGPVNVAVDLARQLSEHGHDVHVFYLDDEAIEQDLGSLPVNRVNDDTALELAKFDVIHSHCLRPDLLVYRNRKRLRHVRKISTIHNIVHADLSFSYSPPIAAIISAVWLAIWRKAFDVVVVLSDFSFRYYASYISSTKLQRVYNGRDLCREGIAVGIAEAERLVVGEWRKRGMTIIGSCAVLTPVKGLEQVLTFLAQNQDYAYVIVGDGPALSDLKYMADRLGIVDRVLFTGRKKDVSPYLQLMDLFALPSRSEGLPLAALEAASVGLPILCSDIEIFREIFDSESAAFFPLDDIAALGVAAESMLDRLYEMGSKARARYLNFFTLKKMAEGYLAVYSNKP